MIATHRVRAAPAQQRWLAQLAVLAGAAGALSTVPMGAALQSMLLLVLLFTGAGSAAMCWVEVPAGAAIAGVIGLSIGAVIVTATTLAWLRVWYPIPSCLALSAIVAVVGLTRLWLMGEKMNGTADG